MRWTLHFPAMVAAAALVTGLALSPTAAARDPEGPGAGSWTVRAFGARLDTTGDALRSGPPLDPLPPVTDFSVTLDDGSGLGVALEYRATRRLGVEALAILADLDASYRLRVREPVAFEGAETRDLASDVLAIGLDVHLAPGRRIDVSVGPLVALVRYGELRSDLGGLAFRAEFEDDTALGVALGADVALRRSGPWAATVAVRRLWSSARTGAEIDVDPLIATAGLAYRWGGRS